MNPQEKAQDLFVKFYERYPDGVYSDYEAKREAKHGALVVVEEKLATAPMIYPSLRDDFINRWTEIKTEIEKL